jgi:ATP-dependent Lon protease
MPSKKFGTMGNAVQNKKKTDKKNRLRKNHDDSDSDSDIEIIIEDSDDDDEDVEEDSESSYEPPKSKKNKKQSQKNSNKKTSKKSKKVVQEEDDDDDEEDVWEDADDEDSDSDDEDDDDDESDIDSDDEDDDEDDEDEEDDADDVVNRFELQKFLSKLFPSKYMQQKVENTMMGAIDAEINTKETKKTSKKSSKKSKKTSKKESKKSKKTNKKRRNEEEEEDEEDEEDEEEYEDEDDEGVYNILFMTGGEEQEDEEYIEDEEGVECDSDDEQMFMKEKYEKVEIPESSDKKSKKGKTDKKTKKSKKESKSKKSDENDKNKEEIDLTDVEQEYLELVDTKKQLTQQLNKRPKNKILRKAVQECNDSIKKLIKKSRTKNAKKYHELIHGDKKQTNEIDYFKKKLSNKEQLNVMKDLAEINKHINIEKPYRLTLLDSKMPAKFKAIALQKLNILKSMDPSDNEYYKIKNWVDTFMRIPFGVYKEISVKMEDGVDVCNNFMENAMDTLDKCVYGHNNAKMQIMQMIGQWISNPSAMGTAIAIKGNPGTGKTSLIKEGISKILGREFTFIALGGAGDSSFLEGHSYTYEGSSWGKIVQILIDSKCMNPVIYFDELDKISDTPRGEEIVGILTHLTDTSQNTQFHDKYFSEIDFDLSKCLFIFSYNDESKVNPILRDRMYRIETKGYDAKEKVIIARDYLLPKIREQVNFKEEEIIIPDDTIQYIVSNGTLTKEESGVRNLKRCLEIIYTKLNLFRLVKSDANILGKNIDLKVEFPFTVTKKVVDILIKNEENQNQSMLAMYV